MFLFRSPALKIAVKPRSADLGQLAHSLDTQTALQRHLGFRRRHLLARQIALLASSPDFLQGTSEKIYLYCFVRQQPLQLGDFSTKCRFAAIFSGRCTSTWLSGHSNRYRHLYSRLRFKPSSLDSLIMLSHAFIRATARRRNFSLYRSFHFFFTLQLLSCKACFVNLFHQGLGPRICRPLW